jgi:F0F1-type ATP synthase gamma subunit
MINARQVNQEIQDLKMLKELSRAYAEIASIKMQKTRDSVLYKRKYLDHVNEVFDEVRLFYLNKQKFLRKNIFSRSPRGITFLAHNGKNVAVFLSANTRLYGELVPKTFELFMSDVKDKGSEATIVGKVGMQMFTSENRERPYTYFDYPDDGMDRHLLLALVKHLVQYDSITIYYGKYFNAGAPKPTSFVLSSDVRENVTAKSASISYLFEPTVEDILRFFEKEIFSNLFEQTIKESQLAKYAARLISMNQAEINIQERLSEVNLRRLRTMHRVSNDKQINSLVPLYRRFVSHA